MSMLDTHGLDSVVDGHTKRQTEYAMRAAFLCRGYVPMQESILRSSEPMNSRYDKGLLIWNTPYAAYQYYTPLRHTTAGTYDHWDEHCWQEHGNELTAYAKKLIEEVR